MNKCLRYLIDVTGMDPISLGELGGGAQCFREFGASGRTKLAQKLLEDLSPRPFEDDKHMLPLLEVAASLSDEVQTCLRASNELSKHVFLLNVQKHYASVAKYILKQVLNGES